MSINDLFRSFFGFSKRNHPPPDDFREDDEYGEFSHSNADMDDVFRHFHGDMQKQMLEIQKQMEDMFQHFGATEFVPAIEMPQLEKEGADPRNEMLKEDERRSSDRIQLVPRESPPSDFPSFFGGMFGKPQWGGIRQEDKVDKDLDGKIEGKNLADLYEKKNQIPDRETILSPKQFSSHSSVSLSTIRGADGKIEQKKTVRDSSGNEETTVTRRVGDQSHTVIIKSDDRGVQEKIENFDNLDEKDLSSFNERWRSGSSRSDDPRNSMVLPQAPNTNTDKSIFKKLFGFDWKDS